ncbi:MAG: response regulator [Phocaeicola sp.]
MEENMQKKILIVDDCQTIMMLLKTKLRDKKFILETASNGEDALAKVASFNPDIILLDIMMPKMDGYEVVERLRADKQYNNILIVLISGLNSQKNINKGLSLGANYYLAKPFAMDELFTIIDNCLK